MASATATRSHTGVSTGGGYVDQSREINDLKVQINSLHGQLSELMNKVEEHSRLAGSLPNAVTIDMGTWSTNDVRDWQKPQPLTTARITFKKQFKSVPKVMVAMDYLDSNKGFNTRVMVYATDIDQTGFTINAKSWFDTQLYGTGVNWVAIEQ